MTRGETGTNSMDTHEHCPTYVQISKDRRYAKWYLSMGCTLEVSLEVGPR